MIRRANFAGLFVLVVIHLLERGTGTLLGNEFGESEHHGNGNNNPNESDEID